MEGMEEMEVMEGTEIESAAAMAMGANHPKNHVFQ